MAAMNGGQASRQASITTYLAAKGVKPTVAWVTRFLDSARPDVPIVSLQQTAFFQILASDITTSVLPGTTFAAQLSDPNKVEQSFAGPILVQLIDIEDISSSAWSQVEAIEAQERGETTRGREVIRVLPQEQSDSADTTSRPSHGGPYKLCVQDVRGTKLFALVFSTIAKISIDTPIGSKMLLRDLRIARGVILLDSKNVDFLGGKVEVWNSTWKSTRKQRLTDKVHPV